MAKFYVQSGTFRRVVAADSRRKAALWAVHEVMQQIMPTDSKSDRYACDSSPASITAREPHAQAQNVTVLSGTVRIDERGFDRHDAGELLTMEVVAEWNEMVMTLDRLQRLLDGPCSGPRAAESRFSENDLAENRSPDDDFFDGLAA